jgi:hypothetical protein
MPNSTIHILPQDRFRFLLEHECKRAERYQHMFSLIRVSCETEGLDSSLREYLAKVIRKITRDSDIIGLTDKGDLALLVHNADNQNVLDIAARIQEKVAQYVKLNERAKALKIEWACFPTHASTIQELVAAVQYQ